MITIKASIDIGGDVTFSRVGATLLPIGGYVNVTDDVSILGQENPPKIKNNGFILGKSRLGQGDVYINKLPYVLGRNLSDSNGNFTSPYIVFPNAIGDTNSMVFIFDEENDAHPNSITYTYLTGSGQVRKKGIAYDDDARIELTFDEPAFGIEVTIDNWNKPNSPFILTGIYAIGDFEILSDNLISFNSDILDRNNIEYPAYGLLTNSANLTFVDFDRTAFELITKRILTAEKDTTVWLENTTENIEEQICKMKIQSMTYNNDNLQVNMQLKDNLEKMQNIMVDALNVDPSNPQSQTAQWYYEELYNYTVAAGFDILSFAELDSDTQNVLANTTIEYPLLEKDTLWNEWTKICELCLCHMYVDNNNRVVLKYSGGN